MKTIFLGALAIIACIYGTPRVHAKTHGDLLRHTHHLLPLTHSKAATGIRAIPVRRVRVLDIIPRA